MSLASSPYKITVPSITKPTERKASGSLLTGSKLRSLKRRREDTSSQNIVAVAAHTDEVKAFPPKSNLPEKPHAKLKQCSQAAVNFQERRMCQQYYNPNTGVPSVGAISQHSAHFSQYYRAARQVPFPSVGGMPVMMVPQSSRTPTIGMQETERQRFTAQYPVSATMVPTQMPVPQMHQMVRMGQMGLMGRVSHQPMQTPSQRPLVYSVSYVCQNQMVPQNVHMPPMHTALPTCENQTYSSVACNHPYGMVPSIYQAGELKYQPREEFTTPELYPRSNVASEKPPKKKRMRMGGISCHQCKRSRLTITHCTNVHARGTKCRKKYCTKCILKYTPCPSKAFVCPACRGLCTCAFCVRKHEIQQNERAQQRGEK